MGRTGIVVVNAAGGAGSEDSGLDAWCAALGLERREAGADLEATVRAAAAERPPYLAVYGGDGTLRTAAAVLAGGDVPLLPVPGGTFNHFATSLDLDDLDAAARAATAGRRRTVPLADVNGEVFLNTCVVGWYPEMVRTRERLRQRLPRPVALGLAFARHATRMRPFTVQLGGEAHRVWLLWVGAATFGLDPGELDQRGREDVLDVRLLLVRSRLPRLRLLADFARRRLRHSEHLERLVAEEPVTARLSRHPVIAALDAEVVELRSPLVLTPAHRTLDVLVPS